MSQPTEDAGARFVEYVLALRPEIAAFDCDGTLWSGDSGRDFFYWEIEHGLIGGEVAEAMLKRYRLYELGEIGEERMCGEMVTMHDGLSIAALHQAAEEFFDEIVSPRIFPEMRELSRKLSAQGCELWAVSSTNNWVVEAGASRFGVASDHVVAACVYAEEGRATSRLLRVPTGELKAVAIREVIGRPVHGVFGNSVHDHAMLEIAKFPFCINPNADLERAAIERDWPIYWPTGTKPAVAASTSVPAKTYLVE
jgi:phosphoserine phosphatase